MRRMSEEMGGMSEAFPYEEWIEEERGRAEGLFSGIFRERKKDLDMLSKNKAEHGRSYLKVGREEMEYLRRMLPRVLITPIYERVLITPIYKTTFEELHPPVRELGYIGKTGISEERAFKELRHLMRKLKRGEILNADEVESLMRIVECALTKERERLLEEVTKALRESPKKVVTDIFSKRLDAIEEDVRRLSANDVNLLRKIGRELLIVDRLIYQLNIEELKERELSIIQQLMNIVPAEIVELREGEIKRLDEEHFVERRGGKIIIYVIE